MKPDIESEELLLIRELLEDQLLTLLNSEFLSEEEKLSRIRTARSVLEDGGLL